MSGVGGSGFLHVDLDQFQASVESQRRPELRGQPLIVGGEGDPTRARQVVTCASYEARALRGPGRDAAAGGRAEMPGRRSSCRWTHAAYEQASEAGDGDPARRCRRWSRCGAGTRLSSAPDTDDPERLAAEIQDAIRAAAGLPSSVGIGDNKLRAKVATGFGKPAGMYRLTAENWMAVMGDRPVQALWGVGSKGAARFAEHGVRTVAELAVRRPGRAGVLVGSDHRSPLPATGPRRGRHPRSGWNRGSPGPAASRPPSPRT